MHAELRIECLAANREIWNSGLAPLGFGGASVCDRKAGVVAIKPDGVSFAAMAADQVVVVTLDGTPIESSQRSPRDLPTHLRLYEAFPAAGTVVHVRSKFTTVWAQAGHAIPCLGVTHAAFFHDEIPVTRPLTEAQVSGNYERAIGEVIVERFTSGADPARQQAVLVPGHGAFTWAGNATGAVEIALALETIAEMALWTLALTRDCPPLPAWLRDKHFPRD